jgi:hypothetical protein
MAPTQPPTKPKPLDLNLDAIRVRLGNYELEALAHQEEIQRLTQENSQLAEQLKAKNK